MSNLFADSVTPIRIFIVEDDPVFLKLLERTLVQNKQYQLYNYGKGKDMLNDLDKEPDILIVDYNLPDINGLELLKKVKQKHPHLMSIVISGQSDVEVVVQVFKEGANDYVVKNENCLPVIQNTIKNLSAQVALRKEVEFLRSEVLDRDKYTEIIGNSPELLKSLKLIQKAERSDILVLITGESGTGKELAARAIHNNSDRKGKPFMPVNMGAIPKDLIESELFGHEKGAFTGAIARRIGKFEEANGGTLFLDEIGDMDISLQVKLLRILEDQQLIRVGSNNSIHLDLRIVVATNKDLYKAVKAGEFREELFYRLQGLLIQLPSLRERKEDILLLSNVFLKAFTERNQIQVQELSKGAAKILLGHNWPGNVRELKSVIERACLLAENGQITEEEIELSTASKVQDTSSVEPSLEDHKHRIILDYLNQYDQNVELVAKKLDIGKATIYRALKKIDEKGN